jgi:hypothetical protein
MNKMFVLAAGLVLAGCSHQSPPVASPIDAITETHCKKDADGFDKGAAVVGNTSRWVWDEAKKGYVYLTSPEMIKHYEDAYDFAKEESQKAIQAAEKAYHDHQNQASDQK